MELDKNPELSEEILEKVTGGVINTFDAPTYKPTWWRFVCHDCGNEGCVATPGDAPLRKCTICDSVNITKEIYTY